MKGVKSVARQEQMFDLVRQYHKGIKSVSGICQENQMCPTSFRYWIRKYNRLLAKQPAQNSNEGFISLHITGEPTELNGKLEILYPNGVGMRVPMKTDVNLLKTLVNLF